MNRIYVLLFFISGALSSPAQTWKMLDDSVNAYNDKGDLNTALVFAQKEVAQAEKEFGKTDSNYTTSLNNLADLNSYLGNYAAAEPLYKQALEIFKKISSEETRGCAESLNGLAVLYISTSNYMAAEPFSKRAIEITKKLMGDKHPDYANTLCTLANIYQYLGNYAGAEPLFKQALEIRKNALGAEHPDYAISLNLLAGLYMDIGNQAAAEPLYKQALMINKKVFGEDNADYASTLNNLAVLYEKLGDLSDAETSFKEVMAIRKKILGEAHPYYATALNNLADVYRKKGDFPAAETLYKQSAELLKKALGSGHSDYASALNNLGSLYFDMGRYSDAEPLASEALEIRKKVLGEEEAHYTVSLIDLADTRTALLNYPAAEPLYLDAVRIFKTKARRQLTFLSETEQERYLKTITAAFEKFQTFSLKFSPADSTLSTQLNNLALFDKGLQLNSAIGVRQRVLSSGDTILINTYNRWTNIKKILSQLYAMPLKKRFADVSVLESEANDLEKQLTRSSQSFREQKQKQNIETADVQAALKKDEAAVEFISFRYFNRGKFTDSIMYAALVLRHGMPYPVLVPLFEEKQLSDVFNATTSVNSLYQTSRGLGFNQAVTSYGNNLYQLVWSKLQDPLAGIKTVYYSPTGQLNRIAFAALPVDTTQLLSDKYHLILLSSTAETVNYSADKVILNNKSNVVLFGGIRYDEPVAEMQAASKNTVSKADALTLAYSGLPGTSRGDVSRGNDWTYLPGTLAEVNKISAGLKKKNIPSTVYTGSMASEDILKSLQGKNAPMVLHIATHGFFFPEMAGEDEKNKEVNREELAKTSKNPLLRTGMILAGGNNKWKNDTLQLPEGLNDGILTAYDVSNMDLSNTRLAILSACQTGLGDIKGNEGVYGMQRAFKMAGVDYLIVSLWSVPDEATQDFMTGFYIRWAESNNLQKAFEETQQAMRIKYKDPYNWAAFVIMK